MIIKNNDLKLTSSIFEAIRKETKKSGFINCFDRFDLLLYIYNHSLNDGKSVHFSNLSQYIKQSDVYLASTLKEGIETGYIESRLCTDDKRKKCYSLTRLASAKIDRLISQNT